MLIPTMKESLKKMINTLSGNKPVLSDSYCKEYCQEERDRIYRLLKEYDGGYNERLFFQLGVAEDCYIYRDSAKKWLNETIKIINHNKPEEEPFYYITIVKIYNHLINNQVSGKKYE